MNRIKGILVAGTLTGLVIITLLALGLGNLGAVADGSAAVSQDTDPLTLPQATNLSAAEALQAWQQYSTELEQTVRTMQDRENAYQAQIDTANQTIIQLQEQVNASNTGSSNGAVYMENDGYEEHDDHEEHEEYEEQEESDD